MRPNTAVTDDQFPGAGAIREAVVSSGMSRSFANSHSKADERKSTDNWVLGASGVHGTQLS